MIPSPYLAIAMSEYLEEKLKGEAGSIPKRVIPAAIHLLTTALNAANGHYEGLPSEEINLYIITRKSISEKDEYSHAQAKKDISRFLELTQNLQPENPIEPEQRDAYSKLQHFYEHLFHALVDEQSRREHTDYDE